jgi:AcrR family transcriptional regulator
MRLPASERRSQLIKTALVLFSQKGYEGTTTRHIADNAGVTEAIIYRHFPTKEELYWAVLEEQCKQRADKAKSQNWFADDLTKSDEQLFMEIAEGILQRNIEDPALNRIMLFCALEKHELASRFYKTFTAGWVDQMADRIRKRVEIGRFRDVDPVMSARAFLGMLIYHYQMQELYGANEVQSYDVKSVAKEFTRIWLNGMTAEEKKSVPVKNKSK